MKNNIKFMAITALFLGLALIIGYLEQFIPAIIPYLPFVKIGFGNIVILLALIVLGKKSAFVIAICKAILVPVFVGNPIMIAYSLPASVVALTVSAILLNTQKISIVTISTLSAIVNIIIQVCIAAAITESGLVFGYLGYLLIISSLSGFAVGTITYFALHKLPMFKIN